MQSGGLDKLRRVGFDDKGILQITLIASWFKLHHRVAMHWALAAKLLRSSLEEIFCISSAQAIVVSFFFLILIFYNHESAKPLKLALTFQEVTAKAGIHFVHNNGAFGKKFCGDGGPGVAFIDYDNDGWPDIFLVNGQIGRGTGKNIQLQGFITTITNGTFTDVTHKRPRRRNVRYRRGGRRLRQ